jgi:hypothetical protein
MKAQQDSGQSQVEYCRARGLDPKYFTLWKRKLRELRVPAKTVEPARLVPVVVRVNSAASPLPARPEKRSSEPAAIVVLRLSLGNGISLSLEMDTGSIPALLRELAALRC